MRAVISRKIDGVGICAIVTDIAEVLVVPDEKVVIFKLADFLNAYIFISHIIHTCRIRSVVPDIFKG